MIKCYWQWTMFFEDETERVNPQENWENLINQEAKLINNPVSLCPLSSLRSSNMAKNVLLKWVLTPRHFFFRTMDFRNHVTESKGFERLKGFWRVYLTETDCKMPSHQNIYLLYWPAKGYSHFHMLPYIQTCPVQYSGINTNTPNWLFS